MIFTKTRNRYTNMMIAIVLMMFAYVEQYYGWPRHLGRILQFVSIMFLLFALFERPKSNNLRYNYPKEICFKILLALSVIIMIRGIMDVGLGYHSIISLIGSPKVFMVYLFPFLLSCSAYNFDYRVFYRICTIWTIIFGLIIVFNLPDIIAYSIKMAILRSDAEEFIPTISSLISLISVPLVIILQREIVPKRLWNISVINLLLLLFVSLLNARRSDTLGIFMVLFFVFLKGKWSRWISAVEVLLLIFFMYEFGLLDFIFARGFEDTRTEVVEHFYEDMDPESWIWGRGATGTYFDPMFVEEDIEGYRSEIETGYLDLILKGGIIYLATYVICLGYAAFLGLRRSKNALCNSFGAIILISLIELIPYGIPIWNLKFFSIWMGIAICLNPTLRAMSNEEVKQFLKLE